MADAVQDVLIAGAGPAGMATALAAHAHGLSLRIIDKHPGRLAFSRAILINPATRTGLAPYGIDAALASRGRPLTALSLRDLAGPLVEGTIDRVPGQPAALLLPQLETEAAMEAALAARGLTIERPLTLTDFRETPDHVAATLTGPDGAASTVRARFLVGADGYHSVVRTGAGLAFTGSELPARIESIDVEMDWPYAADICMWLVPGGGMFAIHLPGGNVRFAGLALDRLARVADLPAPRRELWRAAFDVHFRHVTDLGRGRVWLAGDAAHVHSPVGGRGMNMGIADGLALGAALATGEVRAYSASRGRVAADWVRMNRRLSGLLITPGAATDTRLALARGALRATHALGADRRLCNLIFHRLTGI